MNVAKKIVVAALLLALFFETGFSEARAHDAVSNDAPVKRSFYISPRCKRALLGFAYLATSGTVIYYGQSWIPRQWVTAQKEVGVLDLSDMPLTHHANEPKFGPSTVARSFLPPVPPPLTLIREIPLPLMPAPEFKIAPLTIDIGSDREDEAASFELMKGTLPGLPGEPLPVPWADELRRSGRELAPVVFNRGRPIRNREAAKFPYALKAQSWYRLEDLKKTGTTGLDRELLGDLDLLQRSILCLHPILYERTKKNNTFDSDANKTEFFSFILALRHEGKLRTYWEQTLFPELKNLPGLKFKESLTYDIVREVIIDPLRDPTQHAKSLDLLFKQSESDLDTVRQVLWRLRRYTADSILADPDLAEVHPVAREFLISPGDTKDDIDREAAMGNQLTSLVLERQQARYILETYALDLQNPRPVYVELSVLDTIRVARFLRKTFERAGLEVPIFILPKYFRVPFELARGEFTQDKLLELGKPFFPTEADLRKWGIDP